GVGSGQVETDPETSASRGGDFQERTSIQERSGRHDATPKLNLARKRERTAAKLRRSRAGRAVNGSADALVGAAAADVAAHGVIDVGLGGFRLLRQEGDSKHNLAGLAVAALWDVFGDPGLLHGMRTVGRQAFDGGDFFSLHAGDRSYAGASGLAVDVHGAGATERHAAAKFSAGQVESVAQHPKQWHLRVDTHCGGLAVECKRCGHMPSLFRQGKYPTTSRDG